jgi:exopolyphosphatase/pppGpp-phosphohydrolase
MPQWLQWALIIGGVVAIALLAGFIVRQLRVLQASKRRQEKTEAFQKERRASMVESLQVLAMAVEAEQMEYSEACLRIKGLLDHVSPELLQQQPYRVFQEIHDQIQHMPTHEARQNTETRFVEKMDRERVAIEEANAGRIREAAVALRQLNL